MSGSVSGGTVVGSGSDSIVLSMSGDSAAGANPQFTVNVDGQQIGGRQTVWASNSAGQQQTFTFLGNYGAGPHDVTVTFANNFLMPGQSGDRNVYVKSISYDGQNVSNTTRPIYESPLFPPNSTYNIFGNTTYKVNDTTPTSAGNNSTTPGTVSVGSGNDMLVLKMAEDAYQGDAQFTIKVDGVQIGGTQTTTAHLAEGQAQQFNVYGNWGSGSHNVTISFVNDKIGDFYPGTQLAIDTTDRNLYVMGAQLNGGNAVSGLPWELDRNGSKSFTVTAGPGGGGSNSSNTASSSASAASQASPTASGSSGSQTSNSATIDSGTLASGSASSSNMSFIPGTNSSSSSSSGSSSGSSTSSTTTTGSSDQSSGSSKSLVAASGGQSRSDWTVPGASNSNDNTSSWRSNHGGGHWSGHNGGDWQAKWMAAHSQS